MQTSREPGRQKRNIKRRNSRKKSLSPSDLKCRENENKLRSLSEGSVKVRHKKSNIQRTLTHPITCDEPIVFVKSEVPESDESNIPASSDRDTEDDRKVVTKKWDSGSEMDSAVTIAVRKARRRRTAAYDSVLSSEAGEASEGEAGRMRPEDYRLVFLSSDSSCREDTEDSASTASSAAPPAPDDCDWDYFEPGAPPPPPRRPPAVPPAPACARACSCGAEPRVVAVPVPVPVPVPAALWPALLAFPPAPPAPHWHTYPGLPLDAAALARFTTAAAVAVTAAATAHALPHNVVKTVERSDKAIQVSSARPPRQTASE
ncbi:branchpoint-bridging protein-like [Aricia agestis]|uniref:branchpoint-bridging protein-like n=1 Tax=Aricia agestis TaxID=91739 RepID=UPI001C207037|nr:branchpoint-bridging protein-like [Aricia agestis]